MRSRLLAVNWRKVGLLLTKCRRPAPSIRNGSSSSGSGSNSGDAAYDTTDPEAPGPGLPSSQNGKHRTFRYREGGNKPLPLSSFLDPARLAQRHRHKLPKPPPPKYDDLSPFRKRMADNPYAHLLVAPVRLCHLSLTRLPSSFLLPLCVVADPEPPNPLTLVPLSLYASSLDPRSTTQAQRQQNNVHRKIYLMSRAPLIDYLAISPKEITAYASYTLGSKNTILPPTISQVVETLLAESVLRALAWPFKRSNPKFAVPLPGGPETLKRVPGVAALLYFGRTLRTPQLIEIENEIARSGADIEARVEKVMSWFRSQNPHLKDGWDVLPRANPRVRYPPLKIPTIEYQHDSQASLEKSENERCEPPNRYSVPVFSMVDILGEVKAREVVTKTVFENEEWVVLKEGSASVSVLKSLLKAQWWAAEKGLKIPGQAKMGRTSSKNSN